MEIPALLLLAVLAGDPVPAPPRTPEEVAAKVRELLRDGYASRCSTGYPEEIAKLGHAAVAPLVEGLRKLKEGHPGDTLSCGALALLAEREDVPALRELLLAGRTNVADVLGRLQGRGVPEATDALLDAVAAGGLDADILDALAKAPERKRVAKAIRDRVGDGKDVPEEDRAPVARFFGAAGDPDALPVLRGWAATSRKDGALMAIARALVDLGDVRGVELLVHIAGERRTRFPCRPSTEAEEAAANAPGRLCPAGFDDADRERAVVVLEKVAGRGIFDLADTWRRDLPRQGPGATTPDEVLDGAADAFRKWWDGAKGRLRWDAETKAWVLGG